jgi:hypothetical protein
MGGLSIAGITPPPGGLKMLKPTALALVLTALAAAVAGCPNDDDGGATDVADTTALDTGDSALSDASDALGDAASDVDAGDASIPDGATDAGDAGDAGADGDASGGDATDASDTTDASDATDAADTADAAPDTVECAYVCALDCVCKVDANGCDLPECAEGCDELVPAANAALSAAASGCGDPTGCGFYEYPICGTFGCFNGAVRESADLAALETAASAAGAAGCEPFHCGCGFPEGAPVCLGETCRMCPPDCGSDCEELEAAVTAFAKEAAAGCTADVDCEISTTGPCELGPFVSCHGLAWNTSAEPVMTLIAGYMGAGGCEFADCDCQATEAHCKGGYCVPEGGTLDAIACATDDTGFPAVDKACQVDSDCALVFHQKNCCGTELAWGIAKGAVQDFSIAESICKEQLFPCRCPQEMTQAEDGETGSTAEDFGVKCDAGTCKSFGL